MKQEKLEEKAREVFERQDFNVEKKNGLFEAVKDDYTLNFQVFSSENHSVEEVRNEVDNSVSTVFVDESIREAENVLDQDVSVLHSEEENIDYDLPSFELIGSIAVINDLDGRKEERVVEGITANHPHVETILLKEEQLSGEFRVGGYRKLYGDRTETVHTEFGVDIKVDPTKAYYSERFSTERKRIADQIQSGEKVLIMFAGVGPFALVAAKHSEAEKIVAVEKNPEACEYLKDNITLNNFEDRIDAYCGDVEDILPDLEEEFDHIVMPLPGEADEFLKLASEKASANSIIHYYRFMEEGKQKEMEEEVSKLLDVDHGIKQIVNCGEKSPSTTRVCVEIVTNK